MTTTNNLSFYPTVVEEINKRKEKRQANAGFNDFNMSDLWDFRPGYLGEQAFTVFRLDAQHILNTKIKHRIGRVEMIAQAFYDVISTIVIQNEDERFFDDAAEEREHAKTILTEAAKFEFMGVNCDSTFDFLEFVLCHKNPMFVYEVFTWIIANTIEPVTNAPTATAKVAAVRRILATEQPEFIQMATDAFLLSKSIEKANFDQSEYGHDIVFDLEVKTTQATTDTGGYTIDATITTTESYEPTVGEDGIRKPDVSGKSVDIHVDAKPVQSATPKAE